MTFFVGFTFLFTIKSVDVYYKSVTLKNQGKKLMEGMVNEFSNLLHQ